MEESVAEAVIALCRRGMSRSFTLPGDEVYCLACVGGLIDRFPGEGPEGTPICGGEYQWVTKADLHEKRARCSRCGEPITIEPGIRDLPC
jgi:hypothetical protein